MPLINSATKKAFSANIGREIAAGKKRKQAIAIAYAVRKKAGGSG